MMLKVLSKNTLTFDYGIRFIFTCLILHHSVHKALNIRKSSNIIYLWYPIDEFFRLLYFLSLISKFNSRLYISLRIHILINFLKNNFYTFLNYLPPYIYLYLCYNLITSLVSTANLYNLDFSL